MPVLDAAVKIALACAQGPGEVGARAALRALRDIVPYECAELSCWDEAAGHHRTVANLDYPPEVISFFDGRSFAEELIWLGMRRRSTAFRMRDMPCALEQVPGITQVLWPSGFVEGMTLTLFDADDRYLGVLNLSTANRRHPTDHARHTIRQLAPALSTLLDWPRSLNRLAANLEDGHTMVLAWTGAGRLEPLPAGAATPDAGDLAELNQLAAALQLARVEHPAGTRSYLWPLGIGRWWRVVWRPLPKHAAPGIDALVTARTGPAPYRLSRREVEILTLLTQGLTSAQVASQLCISDRTVHTHVEHLLVKLGVPGRGAATARAVAEGLILPHVHTFA